MGRIMNKFSLFSLASTMLILTACSGRYFPNIEQNQAYIHEQEVQARSMHLTEREVRNITILEDHFYQGNFDGVIESIEFNKETKIGSLDYLNETIKLKAFSECLEQTADRCAESFRLILRNNPDFELNEAELSHPIWGPVFQAEKDKVIASKLDAAINAVHSMDAQFVTPTK